MMAFIFASRHFSSTTVSV